MMTRKDYVATAAILRCQISDAREQLDENSRELFFALETVQGVAEKIADYFASDNEKFDEEKFFAAVWSE